MVHIGTRQIETELLILRRFTMEDVGDAFRGWFSDPDVACICAGTSIRIFHRHRSL